MADQKKQFKEKNDHLHICTKLGRVRNETKQVVLIKHQTKKAVQSVFCSQHLNIELFKFGRNTKKDPKYEKNMYLQLAFFSGICPSFSDHCWGDKKRVAKSFVSRQESGGIFVHGLVFSSDSFGFILYLHQVFVKS